MTTPRDFDDWRAKARQFLSEGVSPETAGWSDANQSALFESPAAGKISDAVAAAKVPKEFLLLLRTVALHRDPRRWDLMYRLLWRLQHDGRDLLDDAADPALALARRFSREVRRDLHKMHAFVRFRELPPLDDGGSRAQFVAWYEPEQLILREGAKFFVRRFANMDWTIVTPEGAAVWDQRELRFEDSPPRDSLPRDDSHEGLWRTYYRSICNVARLKPGAMKREMPMHRWKNLPEAVEIPALMREAPRNVARFDVPASRARHAPIRSAGPVKGDDAAEMPDQRRLDGCRRCPLWENATQAVVGEGPEDARIVLVGEQPGDEEDLKGRPFVGPAGRLLDELLAEAGIDRKRVYVTNAVKHFKWEPRGKRRIHKTPAQQEVVACEVWLRGELARLEPAVVVALGATALRALSADAGPVGKSRGEWLTTNEGLPLVATWHPSALLRARDESVTKMRAEVIEDLRRALKLLSE